MKKAYLEPLVEVLVITGQQMLAFSGGAGGADDIVIGPEPDVNDGTNNSRQLSDELPLIFTDE